MNYYWLRFLAFVTTPLELLGFVAGFIGGRFKSGIYHYNAWAEEASATLSDGEPIEFEIPDDHDGSR